MQQEHGHSHPEALEVGFELASLLYGIGELESAREAYAEVLAYRSVLDKDRGTATAIVAGDLFRLLCEQDDRAAMAEVYYRYLSWIPMRDPATLGADLRKVLLDVEALIEEST